MDGAATLAHSGQNPKWPVPQTHMNRIWKLALCMFFAALFANDSFAQAALTFTPQGRLTLTSNTPVMTGDVVGATTVYYTPYVGNAMASPYLGGGDPIIEYQTVPQLALTLNSSFESTGSVHDIFVIYGGGSPTTWYICAGPAWASTTSRGTGSGSTQLMQLDGIWVNANNINYCYNGTSNTTFVAEYGVYVGSVYMTADGETSMQFKPTAVAGGAAPVLGLWNAYNRVRTVSESQDGNASWTYNSTTFRPADGATGNLNNRISYIDGLGQSRVEAEYHCFIVTQSGETAVAALGLDTTTTPSGVQGTMGYGPSSGIEVGKDHFLSMGFHYVQALEALGDGTASATYAANGGSLQALFVSLEM